MGKRTAQKDAIKDTTSDSQVNSCFPYRWPPASLTFNIYFHLFLYSYITRIAMNNGTSHLKPPKNQNRRVYERLIGLVKRSLRTIGRQLLTTAQLQTLLKEIKAVLNYWPLVYVRDDINSNIPITPAHFLSLNPKIGILQ